MCGYLSYYCLPMSSEQSGHSLMTCWNPTDVCEGKSQRVKEIILFNTEITLFTDLSDKNWAEP